MFSFRRAFTLIELLVVVAISALLLSILLPTLGQARQQARAAQCLGHCRQLGHGMALYYNEWGNYPGHQWRLPDNTRIRWFNVMADYLAGFRVQGCPATPTWEVGRNNSYGYNYKYIGSLRDNASEDNPYRPYEAFPVKRVRNPARTIAFGDSDGTGWALPWGPDKPAGDNNPDRIGNHGYILDPTYIPLYSLDSFSGGAREPYAYLHYRTFLSDRHIGTASLVFVDGHGTRLRPRDVYFDNSLWNGLGFDPAADPNSPWYTVDLHVDYRIHPSSPQIWRF